MGEKLSSDITGYLLVNADVAVQTLVRWRNEALGLEAENERLRDALGYIIERYKSDDDTDYVVLNMYKAAKAALAQEGGEGASSGRGVAMRNKRIEAVKAEMERLRRYADLLERGMSPHEARGTIWPPYGEDER